MINKCLIGRMINKCLINVQIISNCIKLNMLQMCQPVLDLHFEWCEATLQALVWDKVKLSTFIQCHKCYICCISGAVTTDRASVQPRLHTKPTVMVVQLPIALVCRSVVFDSIFHINTWITTRDGLQSWPSWLTCSRQFATKWLLVNHKSGARQEKFICQRRTS